MKISVLTAVFKRNFFSYFANPTGYVFICVFVFLSAISAFWPDDFFNANLANLDQLNKAFAFVMLIFVPAITMSIWADESRQGTDELLLTLPATDFDIVIGKYLAAVAIFTVALLISLLSNFVVLSQLGKPDLGLYVCTHLGYWLLGLAMLAIGMVASFVTKNLTLAYIFGALFNAPLVLLSYIDVIPGFGHSLTGVQRWSLGGQSQEFGRGILGLSGIVYFLALTAIMLYVCMVLIGRRNWARGDNTAIQGSHFFVRALALVGCAVGLVFALQNHDPRWDATSERLSSLSPDTIKLVQELKEDYDKAAKLQPQIAKLGEEVKKQEAAQKVEAKKKAVAEAAAMASAAKGSGMKPPAVPAASGSAKPPAAPVASGSAKPPAAPEAKGSDVQPTAKNSAVIPQPVATAMSTAVNPEPAATAKTSAVNPEPAVPLSKEAQDLADLRKKFEKLKVQGPVRIDAFISTEVPESYVQPRINLLNVLREFKIEGGDMVELNTHNMLRGDPLAEVAKTRYNIVAREVFDNHGGTYKREKIFLGVAFTCGLQKVIVPFLERGLPAEYELVRALCTVTRQEQKRKRIGVLETGAHVFDKVEMGPPWLLVEELKKLYEVVPVAPAELVRKPGEPEKTYDVLLAIQPSAMDPPGMDAFLAAIRGGQPTVIFEDPFFFPYWVRGVPGTYQPRQPERNPMMGFNQNPEKGDIRALWRMLGIDFSDGGGDEYMPIRGQSAGAGTEKVVWQFYNPYPKLGKIIEPEFVFIDHGCGAKEPFCKSDKISSKLQHLFLPGPGFIEDTPEVVKRLIAKWHNQQYAKELREKKDKLDAEFKVAKTGGNRKELREVIDRLVDAEDEFERVSGGGTGEKTIGPDQVGSDNSFKSLLRGIEGVSEISAVGDLRDDLRERFPVRVSGEGVSEYESARLADEEGDELLAEADRLKLDAAKMKSEAEVLKFEGRKLRGPAGEQKRAAAQAERDAAAVKEATAKLAESIGKLKQKLSQAATVDDAIKYAEGVLALQMRDRSFVPLVQTGSETVGTVPVGQMQLGMMGMGEELNPVRSLSYEPSENEQYVLAAHIQGTPCATGSGTPINVVLVADVEMISNMFFRWREEGRIPGQEINFDFDNVTFLLNALDNLAGDPRFLELRGRRPQHRTLEGFDAQTRDARKKSAQARKEQSKQHDDNLRKVKHELRAVELETRALAEMQKLDEAAIVQRVTNALRSLKRRMDEQESRSQEKYADDTRKIDDTEEAAILGVQGAYKFWAVIIPPIPPLLVAALVFFHRRGKEREGVSSKRLR